ncbi:stage III sporulation protein AE [Clostridium sp. AM58-1XD]|uniref:stage III sporulation protein AE n=1 Tax=Clostridium sp. AM58-1XD TaxID=2292307 RepID=UPI001FA8D29D|nr:stage III sporulation protein AE [Clostridium sp. AM58-1XD]
MEKIKRLRQLLLILFIVWEGSLGLLSVKAFAAETDADGGGGVSLSDYDFTAVEEFLKNQGRQNGWNLSFTEMIKKLMNGDAGDVAQMAAGTIKNAMFSEIGGNGDLLLQIMVLGLAGAVFTNFSGVFTANQVSETGFFVTYLLIFSYLAASFFASVTLTGEAVGRILEFMKLLMPSYFLAVAFSGGSASSAVLYESMFLAVSSVEWLFVRVLLPLMKIYLLLSLAGHIAKEDMLSKLTDLIKSGVTWSLKTVMGIVLGLNLLQGMIMPYVDAVKNSTMTKAMEAIPGVGKGAGMVAQLMLGSGILIKNTMGAAAAVILMVITAVPIIKLVILALMYQCAAAALEPVCDKRIISCVTAAAEGHKILVKLLVYSMVLFVIAIAMVCSATNAVYFSG